LFVAAIAATCHGLINSDARVQYNDSRQHLRDDWIQVSASAMSMNVLEANHTLLFCVTQLNLDLLERRVDEISNPESPEFRNYMTFGEVGSLIQNTNGTKQVTSWLERNGVHVDDVTPRGEYIQVTAGVATWQSLLETTFSLMRHNTTGKLVLRCPKYSLPAQVAAHIQSVAYTTQLPLPPSLNLPVLPQLVGSSSYTTLAKLKTAYNINQNENFDNIKGLVDVVDPPCNCEKIYGQQNQPKYCVLPSAPTLCFPFYGPTDPNFPNKGCSMSGIGTVPCDAIGPTPSPGPAPGPPTPPQPPSPPAPPTPPGPPTPPASGASQAVFESIQQNYSPSDLSMFAKANGITLPTIIDVGGHNQDTCASDPNSCGEANLDIQFITGVAPVPTTFYYMDASGSLFYSYLVAIAKMSSPPLVHSISYGAPEDKIESSVKDNFETEMIKLSAIGVTVVVSSGDDGVAGNAARGNAGGCGYSPSYPASAPHVTSVGATQGVEDSQPEVACSSKTGGLITTGGGFSAYYPQPSWQTKAVSEFLASSSAAAGFDKTKRAYPDVALAGHNYAVYIAGNQEAVSGTSASAPAFAAIVSLMNDALIKAGEKPLGFLNPTLYSLGASDPDVYHDVTSGDNKCAAGQGSPTCCTQGFTASIGWDPVTGWGSVNFAKLKAKLMPPTPPAPPTPPPPTPPAPTPGGPVCLPSKGCTVCAACCKSYLGDPADCAACAKAECPNVCAADSTCNTCDACCKSYLKVQADCDACVPQMCK